MAASLKWLRSGQSIDAIPLYELKASELKVAADSPGVARSKLLVVVVVDSWWEQIWLILLVPYKISLSLRLGRTKLGRKLQARRFLALRLRSHSNDDCVELSTVVVMIVAV